MSLRELLESSLVGDNAIRRNAEVALVAAQSHEEYPAALVQLVCDADCRLDIRTLAATRLVNWAAACWGATPVCDLIRSHIIPLAVLPATPRPIVETSILILSVAARRDFPLRWPSFAPLVVDTLAHVAAIDSAPPVTSLRPLRIATTLLRALSEMAASSRARRSGAAAAVARASVPPLVTISLRALTCVASSMRDPSTPTEAVLAAARSFATSLSALARCVPLLPAAKMDPTVIAVLARAPPPPIGDCRALLGMLVTACVAVVCFACESSTNTSATAGACSGCLTRAFGEVAGSASRCTAPLHAGVLINASCDDGARRLPTVDNLLAGVAPAAAPPSSPGSPAGSPWPAAVPSAALCGRCVRAAAFALVYKSATKYLHTTAIPGHAACGAMAPDAVAAAAVTACVAAACAGAVSQTDGLHAAAGLPQTVAAAEAALIASADVPPAAHVVVLRALLHACLTRAAAGGAPVGDLLATAVRATVATACAGAPLETTMAAIMSSPAAPVDAAACAAAPTRDGVVLSLLLQALHAAISLPASSDASPSGPARHPSICDAVSAGRLAYAAVTRALPLTADGFAAWLADPEATAVHESDALGCIPPRTFAATLPPREAAAALLRVMVTAYTSTPQAPPTSPVAAAAGPCLGARLTHWLVALVEAAVSADAASAGGPLLRASAVAVAAGTASGRDVVVVEAALTALGLPWFELPRFVPDVAAVLDRFTAAAAAALPPLPPPEVVGVDAASVPRWVAAAADAGGVPPLPLLPHAAAAAQSVHAAAAVAGDLALRRRLVWMTYRWAEEIGGNPHARVRALAALTQLVAQLRTCAATADGAHSADLGLRIDALSAARAVLDAAAGSAGRAAQLGEGADSAVGVAVPCPSLVPLHAASLDALPVGLRAQCAAASSLALEAVAVAVAATVPTVAHMAISAARLCVTATAAALAAHVPRLPQEQVAAALAAAFQALPPALGRLVGTAAGGLSGATFDCVRTLARVLGGLAVDDGGPFVHLVATLVRAAARGSVGSVEGDAAAAAAVEDAWALVAVVAERCATAPPAALMAAIDELVAATATAGADACSSAVAAALQAVLLVTAAAAASGGDTRGWGAAAAGSVPGSPQGAGDSPLAQAHSASPTAPTHSAPPVGALPLPTYHPVGAWTPRYAALVDALWSAGALSGIEDAAAAIAVATAAAPAAALGTFGPTIAAAVAELAGLTAPPPSADEVERVARAALLAALGVTDGDADEAVGERGHDVAAAQRRRAVVTVAAQAALGGAHFIRSAAALAALQLSGGGAAVANAAVGLAAATGGTCSDPSVASRVAAAIESDPAAATVACAAALARALLVAVDADACGWPAAARAAAHGAVAIIAAIGPYAGAAGPAAAAVAASAVDEQLVTVALHAVAYTSRNSAAVDDLASPLTQVVDGGGEGASTAAALADGGFAWLVVDDDVRDSASAASDAGVDGSDVPPSGYAAASPACALSAPDGPDALGGSISTRRTPHNHAPHLLPGAVRRSAFTQRLRERLVAQQAIAALASVPVDCPTGPAIRRALAASGAL